MRRARILIVEDERVVARDIAHQLRRIGHEVAGSTSLAEEAADLATQSDAELVLMDIRLEGERDGIEAAREIRERCGLPVIFLTAYADDETLERAADTGPFGYLLKPFDDSELRTAITLALTKHEAERKLRESERRYAVTLASLADGVITTDAQARVTFMNPVAEQLTGMAEACARGRPLRDVFRLLDEGTHQPLEEPASRVLRGESVEATSGLLRSARGHEAPVEASAARLLDRGVITGVVLVFRDASQARLARAASTHRVARERLELALRGSKTAVYDFDMPDGDLASATLHEINCWESLGYETSPDELTYGVRSELWHPDDRAPMQRAVERYLAGETSDYEVECRVRHRDGNYRWRLSRGVALRDEQGVPRRFVGSTSDITEQKQLEHELRSAKDAAEAANRTKDEFLANVSHEIRTPLTAILGMTDLVLESPLSAEQRSSLTTARSAASSLLGMINDLLDFAKIEAGKLELERAPIALRDLLEEIWRALSLRAQRKGLQLVFDIDAEVPDHVAGDAGRLQQVLVNLLDNAIKFTERGQVKLEVQRVARVGEVALAFTVTDTGIGIAADNLSRVFGAFEQEDPSATRRFGGTGLGLTIAARAVALMGGRIDVESELGRGSRFHFEARFDSAPTRSVADQPARVLVLEHNAVSRGVLLDWLTSWGVKARAADDGMSALDALWHGAASGQHYDAVLVNPRMPGLDLQTLTRRLRGRAELTGTRLIALGAAPAGTSAEVDVQLQMPVSPDELRDALRRLDLDRAGEPKQAEVDTRALRVLVAEDNPLNAQFLRQLLTRRGHQLELAEDGEQALARLAHEEFDLLLLDLHMPHKSGFQVIEAVRASERETGAHLPVIALTARSRSEDRERCLAAGMDDFLTKPLLAADLWAAIARVSPRGQRGSVLDGALLLAACDGEPAILDTLCTALHEHLQRHVDDTQRSLREADAPRLREDAHKLFNMVAAFSSRAGTLASELEDHAARGDLAAAAALIDALPGLASALLRETTALTVQQLRAT
ncbi:MAG: response regulator [Polyangiales bacterium]